MLSMGGCMASSDGEIDPIKIRTGLFAMLTARLEDAHDFAVKGQSIELNNGEILDCISDINSAVEEMEILVGSIELIVRNRH